MSKKLVISHVITLVLGVLGGFLGRDLSGFQKPAEAAVVKALEHGTITVDGGPPVIVDMPPPTP